MRRWVAVLVAALGCSPARAIESPAGFHVRIPPYGAHREPICGPLNVVLDEGQLYLDGVELRSVDVLEEKAAADWPEWCARRMMLSAAPDEPFSRLLPVIAVASRHRFEVTFVGQHPKGKWVVVG